MFIVKHRKIFYTISVFLVLASIAAMSIWGFALGIDFKGGSSLEFQYNGERPEIGLVRAEINAISLENSISGYSLIPSGERGYILNMRTVSEEERKAIISSLTKDGTIEIEKFNSVGPTLGKEAARKSLISIILVILCIVLFLTFAFRKVSKPVSSWKYGVVSILALCHDIIIPTGVFVTLHHFLGSYQIDTLYVTAILVILGFSVHDTIVVFDRIRENLKNNQSAKNEKSFEEIVGQSINQTFVRSINTSATTLLAVLAVYLFGPEATRNFSLALFIGIFFGTYSSIFIGSNLLVTIEKRKKKA